MDEENGGNDSFMRNKSRQRETPKRLDPYRLYVTTPIVIEATSFWNRKPPVPYWGGNYWPRTQVCRQGHASAWSTSSLRVWLHAHQTYKHTTHVYTTHIHHTHTELRAYIRSTHKQSPGPDPWPSRCMRTKQDAVGGFYSGALSGVHGLQALGN